MWYFVCGLGVGVYVGTYYNCRPVLDKITKLVKDNMPPEKK
jgi:hypothetical protein